MNDTKEFPEDFIDFDNILTRDNEFMEVYEAFGYGKLDPQKTVIFFKKALIETEEDLEKNPDSIRMQKRKVEIENYLTKINKIINHDILPKEIEPEIANNQTIKKNEFYNSLSTSIQLQLDYLFSVHPKFKKYFPFFFNADYIEKRDNYILWKKSKVALCKFIRLFAGKENKIHWAKYEKLFNIGSLRTAEGSYPDRECIEYEELVKKIESKSK